MITDVWKYRGKSSRDSPVNSVTIKGSNLISGEGGNVTRCGDNGKCTLTVDGAKEFSGVISGSRTFDITSQYRVIDTNRIDAGSFSGSAIATVLMQ